MREYKLKSFGDASGIAKQLISLATALILLSITFSTSLIVQGNKLTLFLCWLLLFVSIICGIATLMAIAGTLNKVCVDQNENLGIYDTNISVWAGLQILSFLVGLVILIVFGFSTIFPKKEEISKALNYSKTYYIDNYDLGKFDSGSNKNSIIGLNKFVEIIDRYNNNTNIIIERKNILITGYSDGNRMRDQTVFKEKSDTINYISSNAEKIRTEKIFIQDETLISNFDLALLRAQSYKKQLMRILKFKDKNIEISADTLSNKGMFYRGISVELKMKYKRNTETNQVDGSTSGR